MSKRFLTGGDAAVGAGAAVNDYVQGKVKVPYVAAISTLREVPFCAPLVSLSLLYCS